jgi:phosphate transport system substrate-binding protein
LKLKRVRLQPALTFSFIGILVLAACTNTSGGGESTAASGGGGAGGVEGEIFVSGSSTVQPITNAVAQAFQADNAGFEYTVEGPGTGDGFALFCNGETDISDASRAISDDEVALCEEAGVEYVELLVAYDGLSVVTSADNTDISCLSFLDLYALLGPESEGFADWSDAAPLADELAGELGSDFGESHAADYPDAPLEITAPGEESGTEARGTDAFARIDYQSSPNDNVIVGNAAGSGSSLGWVGLAFASEAEGIATLDIDAGDGCVAPSDETVADESYPISRPLYIYPSLAAVDENPAVAPFVDYYVSVGGLALAGDVGYVALTEEQAQATRDAWEGR